MFFIVSKLVETVLLPSNDIGLLAALGILALIVRRRRIGLALLTTSAVLLIMAGWTPLGSALVMTLEDRFPPTDMPASVAGIVMLGGAVNTHITEDRGSITLNDNAERVVAVATLSRRYPGARILLSGGSGHLLSGHAFTESEGARRLLVELGVPQERIELEERSRTTFENAMESVAVAKPKPGEIWLLVTSAYNMPRAVASFRAANFPIVAYPVDYRTRQGDLHRPMNSVADGLVLMDIAAHEWLGLATYRLAGKTADVLPSP
ncbi:YdcF family protein [Mesorhizobium sp. M7A.F.Ca.US.008.03.1.1]|uniref:YdcF family protein n=1 Tax=Mesorhizobium sp. M7A.F.Ca.US.008.03.1.1 TaxID=2496742 RepID=UPI000FCA65F3|nr:YdcF family protein [Mesorhizobium sp. M7A.F.Ca.US.008.03.1.1]RUW60691.1 YdcF family protein [Mesorhizobium sp. M7A.F.Ca.US.008.03.1.1]